MKLEFWVDETIHSHKLYRYIKKFIPDIHQEIYSQVREKISRRLEGEYIYNIPSTLVRVMPIDQLLKQALYQRIDLLAIKTKKIAIALVPEKLYPPRNKEYLSACQQLFYAVLFSGRLKHPGKNYRYSHVYPDIIDEYEIEIWQFICKKVQDFDFNKQYNMRILGISYFMIWLNSCADFLLKKAYVKCHIEEDERIYLEDCNSIDLNNHQDIQSKNTEIALFNRVIYLIFNDQTGCFKNTYIRNQPQANFRAIALLLFNGNSMKNIADKLGVPLQTLYTFYHRWINRYRSTILENI
ncbi:MAG: helix-turn-helix domain-containing protein [Calothrix sp. MO_192.B10]|nr:helix-turn-helix domain-containing protein [Calothrix sp. MO_192.B10]